MNNPGIIWGISIGALLLILISIGVFLLVVAGVVLIIVFSVKNKRIQEYKQFVIKNSGALKKLNEINSKYQFARVGNYTISNIYDNKDYYDTISCVDYLTYKLTYKQKDILQLLSLTEKNREEYKLYREEINSSKIAYGQYSEDTSSMNIEKLKTIEKQIVKESIKKPNCDLSITIELYRSDLNGNIFEDKGKVFYESAIKELLRRINQKRGDFYLDESVWNSICRVERGKVTNKLRFAIYERYNYMCRKCGSTENLEIDHIIPIAKGGKTTWDNLQTLCRDCNQLKGDNINSRHFNVRNLDQ